MVQCSYIGKGFGHIVLIVVGARSRKYMVRRWGISAGSAGSSSSRLRLMEVGLLQLLAASGALSIATSTQLL
ncbi:TPA: hypothetical protein L5765_32925, partial [Pseudomonas aeruginosa]|nr:hypothetical protein [Pseudomonas aeruginosa]